MYLFETKTTKLFSSSFEFVVLTKSHNFHTFSSQKQAAYEHSKAEGTYNKTNRTNEKVRFTDNVLG